MRNKSILTSIGILTYIALSFIDKLIYKVPDFVYIPVALVAIIIMIIGIVKNTKNK